MLLNDCLRLQTTELLHTINDVLYDVFEAQIRHVEASLRNEKQNEVNSLWVCVFNMRNEND